MVNGRAAERVLSRFARTLLPRPRRRSEGGGCGRDENPVQRHSVPPTPIPGASRSQGSLAPDQGEFCGGVLQ